MDEEKRGAGEGAEKIRPCLIGGFLECDSTLGISVPLSEVPRVDPYVCPDGSVCSLDMVRIALKFAGSEEHISRMQDMVQRLDCESYEQYTMGRSRPGRYARLYTLGYGGSTVSLGVGQFVKGVHADMHRGFLEFNPNKLGEESGFIRFLELVAGYVQLCELSRYDLAVDLPVARALVRTRKDRRKYAFEQSAALTEYLGIRNSPGRVKVYDKAAESGLVGVDLTRVELTCSGAWSASQVLDHWPTVYRVRVADGSRPGVVSALAGAVAELVDAGGSAEKYLSGLDHHTRKKVRDLIEGPVYACPELGAAHVLLSACGWCDRLAKS